MTTCGTRLRRLVLSNPFAAFGVLDIAITRQQDPRYKTLASEMMIELGKDQLLRPDGVDCCDILHLFTQLTLDQSTCLKAVRYGTRLGNACAHGCMPAC